MFAKNVPVWERWSRFLVGVALAASAAIWLRGQWVGYLVLMTAAVAVVTGLVGFCPMCALMKRCPVDGYRKN